MLVRASTTERKPNGSYAARGATAMILLCVKCGRLFEQSDEISHVIDQVRDAEIAITCAQCLKPSESALGIGALALRAFNCASQHGFWSGQNPLDITVQLAKLALITSEIGEAVEAVRHADMVNLREELADIIIRVLDLSEALGFNMADAIDSKMRVNEARPHMHGKKA